MDFDSAQSTQPTNPQTITDQPQPLSPAPSLIIPPSVSPSPDSTPPAPQVPLTPIFPTPPTPIPQNPFPQPFSPQETPSSVPPVIPEPAVTSVTPEMPATPPQPQNFQITPTKKIPILLIILLVLIFSVGLGYGAFYFLELPKENLPDKTIKSVVPTKAIVPTVVLEQPTVAPVATSSAVPSGYILKETLCYSIIVPVSNNVGEDNSCDLSYTASVSIPKNNSLLVGAGINSELKEYISSQDMAEKWLVDYQKNNPKNSQITKGLTKVGGVDSYFYLIKDAISNLDTQYTFVYVPGKYTTKNLPVTGFSIIQTFSDPDNADAAKSEMEKLFSTWQWK